MFFTYSLQCPLVDSFTCFFLRLFGTIYKFVVCCWFGAFFGLGIDTSLSAFSLSYNTASPTTHTHLTNNNNNIHSSFNISEKNMRKSLKIK